MSTKPFFWSVRVYWEDTDAGGVVYHASYLRFIERARTEWLRTQGIEQERLRAEVGIAFVVRNLAIEFLKPAKLDDVLAVTAQLDQRRAASLLFRHEIFRAADRTLILKATVRSACIDSTHFQPCRIPDQLFQEPDAT